MCPIEAWASEAWFYAQAHRTVLHHVLPLRDQFCLVSSYIIVAERQKIASWLNIAFCKTEDIGCKKHVYTSQRRETETK